MFWLAVYFIGGYTHPIPSQWAAKMKPYDKLIWRHRVISIYHALLALGFSSYWYITDLDMSCSKPNTNLEVCLAANTSMYLVVDGLFMKVNGFLDNGNFWHHVFGFLGYTSSAYLQFNMGFLAMLLWPAEITNIQMNLREVYKRIGWRFTKAYYLNEFQYLVLYFTVRTTWIPGTYYFMFNCDTTNPVIAVIFPLHVAMNYYYSSHIPNLFKHRIREIKNIQENSGSKLEWFSPLDQSVIDKLGIKSYETYKT